MLTLPGSTLVVVAGDITHLGGYAEAERGPRPAAGRGDPHAGGCRQHGPRRSAPAARRAGHRYSRAGLHDRQRRVHGPRAGAPPRRSGRPGSFPTRRPAAAWQPALPHIAGAPFKVLVSHAPPRDTKIDRSFAGLHFGSGAVRDFLLSAGVGLCISGHIHEAPGEDRLGGCLCVNLGPFKNGRYALITIDAMTGLMSHGGRNESHRIISRRQLGALPDRSTPSRSPSRATPAFPWDAPSWARSSTASCSTTCPGDPKWLNRDRFVLSAGHGCMLLYSLLHLSGYDLSLDDLKGFRQLGSRTPGHPEWDMTPGVEATGGPAGAGTVKRRRHGNRGADARREVQHPEAHGDRSSHLRPGQRRRHDGRASPRRRRPSRVTSAWASSSSSTIPTGSPSKAPRTWHSRRTC